MYHETDQLMESYLQSGKTVIDASRNFTKEERQVARHIATQLKAEVVTICVDTPEGIARQRLLENRRKQARRDVTDTDFEEILQVWEPPTADKNPIVFHNGDDIDNWFAKNNSPIDYISLLCKGYGSMLRNFPTTHSPVASRFYWNSLP